MHVHKSSLKKKKREKKASLFLDPMKTELRSVSHNNEKKWKRKEKKKGEGEVEVPHLMCVNVRFRAQETKRQLLYYFLFFFF